jgi:IPT/TIG domain-containing protein
LIPSITAIEPSVAQAGRKDLVLGITGTNFVHDVTRSTWAIWTANGADTVLSTTVLNSSTLTAIVPAALLSNQGEAQVQVVTGDPKFVLAGPEYPRSNSVGFEIAPGMFPANVLGTYLATFTASSSCASALPEAAREDHSMTSYLRLVTLSVFLLGLSSCDKTGPTLPAPPSVPSAVIATPPPAPTPPTPRDLSSLSMSYRSSAVVVHADSTLACDPRRKNTTETLRIDLHVDGNSRVVEADVTTGDGRPTHFHGTVTDAYIITASLVTMDAPTTGRDANCSENPSETLVMRFGGPNYDGCQGFSGQIQTKYAITAGEIVAVFGHDSC